MNLNASKFSGKKNFFSVLKFCFCMIKGTSCEKSQMLEEVSKQVTNGIRKQGGPCNTWKSKVTESH